MPLHTRRPHFPRLSTASLSLLALSIACASLPLAAQGVVSLDAGVRPDDGATAAAALLHDAEASLSTLPRRGGHAIGRPTETPQALHTFKKTGTRQATGALADHQRAAQRLFGLGVQRRQVLQGGGQGLHGGRGKLQALQQRAVGQQMALAARLVQFVEQPIPVLTADT